MSEIDDIWNLANGDVDFLHLDKYMCDKKIHNEAYNNKVKVKVGYSPAHDVKVCTLLKYNPTECQHYLSDLAEHMVLACADDETATPFHSGDVDPTSLRTALYRKSKKFGIKVSTGMYGSAVYCKLGKETSSVTTQVRKLEIGESVSIPVASDDKVYSIRSSISNLSKRKGLKLKTRYSNGVLKITRIKESTANDGKNSKSEYLRKWVTGMPWDISLPLPDVEMSPGSVVSVCNRAFSGVCTFSGGTITKNSYRLCKENNELVLYIKGKAITTFNVTRKTQLKSEDWDLIKSVLKRYNVTIKDLV